MLDAKGFGIHERVSFSRSQREKASLFSELTKLPDTTGVSRHLWPGTTTYLITIPSDSLAFVIIFSVTVSLS